MQNSAHEIAASRGHHLATRGLIALFIILLAGLASFLMRRSDFSWNHTVDRPARFALDLADQVSIDPELLDYQQVASIELPMEQLRGIASGPQDRIYVAGDQAIHVFDAGGKPLDVITLDSQPQCVAVGQAETPESARLFVGSSDGIKILSDDHKVLASWPLPAENSILTSIAAVGGNVFVADAGSRVVWRFSETGEVLGQIGKSDSARQVPGFVIPSHYFDIVAGSEGLLSCVNPGKLQVSTYSFDGDLGSSWGRAGSSVADFFGCCNPSHLARFADGRFATSERGIPRIKVYSETGELESVVAGPQQLDVSQQSVSDPRHGIHESVFDIAVDLQGRVLALDSRTRTVRIFAPFKR